VSDELVTFEEAEKVLLERGSKIERFPAQHAEGIVNPIVLAKLLKIRPQMVYNYIKQGKLPEQANSSQRMVIPWVTAVEFARGYLDRKAIKAAKVAAELRGE
jgi:hypothetical protein